MQTRLGRFALTTPLLITFVVGAFAAARADDTSGQRYICREIAIGEIPNAQMTATTSTQLVCRPVTIMLKMSGGTLQTIGRTTAKSAPDGPDLSHALTPQEVNDAYVKFIDQEFHIDHSS